MSDESSRVENLDLLVDGHERLLEETVALSEILKMKYETPFG